LAGAEVTFAVAWITKQVVFDGFVSGLAIGLIAVGIVLVYRSTRVINFAVGNMGVVAAGLLSLMVVQYHVPFWPSLLVSLVVGTLFAVIVQLVVIRRLFTAPRVIVLVATIGIGQLALTLATAYPGIGDASAPFPVAISNSWRLAGLQVQGSELAIIVVAPVAILALSWFLARTDIGKGVKASADNPQLARISGINPKIVSLLVWAIAGVLSSLSLILIAGQSGTAGSVTLLGPETLVRALAAAVIGGMRSFPRTMVAAIVIGMTQNVMGFNFLNTPGLIDFILLIGILIAVWFQSRERAETPTPFSFTPKPRPIPERLRAFWWMRMLDRSGIVLLAIIGLLLPIIVTTPSRQLLYAVILSYAICGTSLTVLTGWAGQVSLGQMAFAGLGAMIAATLDQGGVPFFLAIVIAAACTTVLAAIVGIGSLRVRGLLLVVTTFALALAAEQYFYQLSFLNGGSQGIELFPRGTLFGLTFLPERSYYYAVLVVLFVVLFVVARLRRSGIGRTMIAVRDNPDGAAAYTVSPTRAKMQAFALAGAIAGLGGALLAGVVQDVPFSQEFFLVNDSLVIVSLVVIGGLGSTMGPVLGALWVIGLPAIAPANALVALLTSSLGLLILLLYFPSGLAGVAYRLREAIVTWAERRVPETEAARPATVPTVARRTLTHSAFEGDALVAEDVTVQFGGIVAVDDVTIRVGQNEILGLIGANGAGKSTLMNALGGYVPSTGTVMLLGRDVTRLSPAGRARNGLGRTFQAARLFPELTVRETVQVALESRSRTDLIGAALGLPGSIKAERAKRAEAAEILDFLGLGGYAEHYISNLSTGTRRIVELAGLVALSAQVLCLDEPTAGVAQRETEAFGPLLLEIRRELGASMVLIEHDMPLAMSVSDRVYCLETGEVIAEGTPTEIRSDPTVIASYLGADERAITRSVAKADDPSGAPREPPAQALERFTGG